MTDANSRRWQTRMIPMMTIGLMIAGLFFVMGTVWQFDAIKDIGSEKISVPAKIDWPKPGPESLTFDQHLQLASLQASFALENEALKKRYQQGHTAFIVRMWTRFIAFATGMILALVGAVFVLGKLDTEQTEMNAQSVGWSLSLKSASPGVMLAGFGTLLMAMAITIPASVDTRDGAIYFANGPLSTAVEPPSDANDSANPIGSDEPKLRAP